MIAIGYYVDKTIYAQALIEWGNPVFITRPRRFGKSLFIDTLATICSGEKEIFQEYYIGKPENGYDWKRYPVVNLNFSSLNHTPGCLENSIINALEDIADLYDITIQASDIQSGLIHLVKSLAKLGNAYGPKIVVLIDEYDAPVVNLSKGSDNQQSNLKIIKDFFITLKSLNNYFKLTFITGVSKFNLSDVFSGANHLKDITIDKSADAMFGYRQAELAKVFADRLEAIVLAWHKQENRLVTTEEVLHQVARYYNGYQFCQDGIRVYNPWSALNFLDSGQLRNYWYSSGSSTILIDQMLANPSRFNFNELPIAATEFDLMYTGSRNEINLTSLMFQTGYLTIEDYDSTNELYKLNFSNKEVNTSF